MCVNKGHHLTGYVDQSLLGISIRLTSDQKEQLERRARKLGISRSAYVRGMIANHQKMSTEIIAREWVAIALQLRKLEGQIPELRSVVEELKQLIERTTSE